MRKGLALPLMFAITLLSDWLPLPASKSSMGCITLGRAAVPFMICKAKSHTYQACTSSTVLPACPVVLGCSPNISILVLPGDLCYQEIQQQVIERT